ncbi:MAG: phosphatidate cytidylyltransferase [Enterobacteriaceae bacterium]
MFMLFYRFISFFLLLLFINIFIYFFSVFKFVVFLFIICIVCIIEYLYLFTYENVFKKIFFVFFTLFILFYIIRNYLNSCKITYHQVKFFSIFSIFWSFFIIFLIFSYYNSNFILLKIIKFRCLIFTYNVLSFFVSVLILRFYWNSIIFNKFYWLSYLIILITNMDLFSYIFGKFFGKTLIAEKISPKKTLEGFIAGCLSVVIVSFLFSLYIFNFIYVSFIFFSFLSGVLCLFGDLIESIFKREAGVKDSGFIIPGHGGILDRIDSFSFVAPIFIFFKFFFF